MDAVKCERVKRIIPTYPEPPAEEWPMFAENRVHQRTNGDPYPNKVVVRVNRDKAVDREYELIVMENEYLKIEIMPEIGGRIYAALDKTTGYDFFYKQHVIKPALIGVLGSWISGGVEFNWPFHHRASGFMPCDVALERQEDGTAVCHLSEHEPTDHMRGTVSVILRPGEKRFETRVRLYNRTDMAHSFLWWENAAVPVHQQYQIFFPPDVSYVNFHYLKSRIPYPMAGGGSFNGIPMEKPRDISWHKNTVSATSYFACASAYDFFGGYDHRKQCGVVHIGDHHVSPGKKMFTWGYGQLARSWENALTDADGAYAELMAGSYSDNQPNFSWLEPYETKEFSQYWYPISEVGTPQFANLETAFSLDREKGELRLQTTRRQEWVTVTLKEGDRVIFETTGSLRPEICAVFQVGNLPELVTVTVMADGETLAQYEEKTYDRLAMPDVIKDIPVADALDSAQDLYLAGVHVAQYRDPAAKPDVYFTEALRREPRHIPSLIAMAAYEYSRYDFHGALDYADRAVQQSYLYNERVKSGEVYYVRAQIREALGDLHGAYDDYHRAAWAADSVAKAMTRIALLDLRFGDEKAAKKHAETALDYGRRNTLAWAVRLVARKRQGEETTGDLAAALREDPLSPMMRYEKEAEDFYAGLSADPLQTCLDIAFDFEAMGLYRENVRLLDGLLQNRPETAAPMLFYALGYYRYGCGEDGIADYRRGSRAKIGASFPVRKEEKRILEDVIARTGDTQARQLLGCLLYHKRHYEKAAALWEQSEGVMALRNLAVAYFSHLNRPDEALLLMEQVLARRPSDEEALYETVVLMDKLGKDPQKKISLITAHAFTRDDLFIELAKAYNQAMLPEKALETLMSHRFVPCEGGEHAIADQYLFAYLELGRRALENGQTDEALVLFQTGQVLPDSLGAGLWNRCKLVPLRYFEAVCREKNGDRKGAIAIFSDIAGIDVEYFSNMYLKELPYYQACALEHLDQNVKAQRLMTVYRREWEVLSKVKDNGFFGTTPFFVPFMDRPERLRLAQGDYLAALVADFVGDADAAQQKIAESYRENNENLMALFFETHGFLPRS